MKISKPFGVGLITHIETEEPMKLSEAFHKAQFENFDFLLQFGSIYVNDVRTFEDKPLAPKSVIRVHRNPKRHPIQDIPWKDHIIEETEEFLVIDKPYRVPVHATVDNYMENVIYQYSKLLESPLYVTHRLDIETTGLLMIAKTKAFQNTFNFLLQHKQILKKYRVLTNYQPPIGLIRHYIQSGQFTPKLVSLDPIEGWPLCEMVIEETSPKLLPNGQSGYESTIQLITGRTHQIRAQMTGLAGPIFGDTQYGDDENSEHPLGLKASELKFKWPAMQKEFHYTLP